MKLLIECRNILLRALLAAVSLTAWHTSYAVPIDGTGAPADHASLAAGTVIDFEALTDGSLHPDLTFAEVVITGIGGDLQILDAFNQYGINYNVTGNGIALRTGTPVQAVTFDFLTPVSAIGLNIGGTDKLWRLSAFSSSHTLLGTIDIPLLPTASDNTGQWFGLAIDGIASASLVNVGYEISPGSATQDFIFHA